MFNSLADTVEWILKKESAACVFHYLDDFIIEAPSSSQCEEYLRILLIAFERLDIPVAKWKSWRDQQQL